MCSSDLYSQFMPSFDYAQYAQPASAPTPEPVAAPSFDYSQFMPSFDYAQYAQPASAPTPEPVFDYSQFYAPPAPAPEVFTPLAEMVNPIGRTPVSPKSDMDKRRVSNAAAGGKIDMRDGSFVVDARTVSELGNGSSNAGMEFLSRMGGRPVRGPGDGVSDSVPARIGGKQEARVARDEVIFPPEAVRRLGGGSEKRGTQKLYAMMEKAHKARKKAGRGSDTKLRKGLA